MYPDFNKSTIDILAKRAAFRCSNPDCRVTTVGPNSIPTKATLIGEAAHIFGARPNAMRFDPNMTDQSRADITNGLWLCRNCHKLIDSENHYSAFVLFTWRESHEVYVLSELGNATDRILKDELSIQLSQFMEFPPLIRRIIIDKPVAWEYRLTAELMRHYNSPLIRRLHDLRGGYYVKPQIPIEDDNALTWIRGRLSQLSEMITPITKLFTRLNNSWGLPGEPGDADEIRHTTCLIGRWFEQVINFEESVRFVLVSDNYQRLLALLRDTTSVHANKVADLADQLDQIARMNANVEDGAEARSETISIVFDVPDNWEVNWNRELLQVSKSIARSTNKSGCATLLIAGFIFLVILYQL